MKMSAFVVTLQGGAPWGLRLQGGSGTGEPLRIAKINPGSKASRAQLHVGDIIETLNGVLAGQLPLPQAQKLLHNNTNDLQLKIYRNQNSLNGSYHPQGRMSAQSSFVVTNDSGFSGTGSTTSPQISPTNGFPMSTTQQKDEPPPPASDIPNNNNNLRKDEDEFWPPPPPPDESLWSPSQGSAPRSFIDEAPPPPPAKNDGSMSAPVWTPAGGAPVKKEFKSVKPDLTSRPKTNTANQPTYTAPPQSSSQSPFSWTPNQQQQQPAPMTVDTLPDPSHILSPSYVSPRSLGQHAPLSQSQYPPPQSQYAPSKGEGLGPSSPRPIPGSPSRPIPQTGQRHGTPPQMDYDGVPNGYGFLPSSAMSGSPSALKSENLPAGALFQKQIVEGDKVHTDTFYPVQNVTRKTSSTEKHEAPSYQGIGPRDKDGMPTGLRQHVPEENRKNWYKEMFKSIHQQDKDDEDAWKAVSAENRSSEPARVIKNTPSYRVQPGRIHDFQPGKSALAEHEKMVQSQKDGPYNMGRRLSAPGSGYASDEEARKAYRNFVKSGELPTSYGLAFGAPPARRDIRPTTANTNTTNSSLTQSTTQPTLAHQSWNSHSSSTLSLPTSPTHHSSHAPLGSPSHRGAVPQGWGGGRGGMVPSATLTRTASLSRGTGTGLPKRRQRYSVGSELSAAERLGIKSPPPSRLPASATPKHPTGDSRYDYLNQYNIPDRAKSEPKREYREPDASYNRSLPEYNPVPRSPTITDGRFDDFEFTPPVKVLAAKQEVPPQVERSPSLYTKITRASAIALYPFTAQTKKELSFHKGDTIYLTRDIDKNWYEGEHHGNRGIFPKSYVETVTSIEEARNLLLTAPSSEGKGRVRYKFKGETTNELSVNKGDIVELTRRVDDNWWEVRQGGKAGIVPVAYLDIIREPAQGMMSPQLSPGGGGGVPRSPLSPSGRASVSPTPIAKSPSYSTQSSNPAPLAYSSPPPSSPTIRDRIGHSPHSGAGRGGKPSQNSGFPHRGYPEGERFSAVYSYQPSNDDELELMEGETVVVMEKCDDGWYVGFSEATGQFGTFPGNYVEKL